MMKQHDIRTHLKLPDTSHLARLHYNHNHKWNEVKKFIYRNLSIGISKSIRQFKITQDRLEFYKFGLLDDYSDFAPLQSRFNTTVFESFKEILSIDKTISSNIEIIEENNEEISFIILVD